LEAYRAAKIYEIGMVHRGLESSQNEGVLEAEPLA